MNTPKYITLVAMLVLIFLTPKADLSEIKHKKTGEPISIVKCVFDKTAFFWIGGREKNYIEKITSSISSFLGKSYFFSVGDYEAELDLTHDENFSFIISGLDTENPKLKGNFGETPLNILWRTEDTIYLAELTPRKNALNYITLFIKQRTVIFSKQYLMPSLGNGKLITAYMMVGHFE